MKPLLAASILCLGVHASVKAGDVIQLKPPPSKTPTIYAVYYDFDAEGRVTAENGIPVATRIPKLRLDAERGDVQSQVLLCKALDRRLTGSTNRVEAYKWAIVASTRGETEAKSLVRTLGLFLTDAERAQGQLQAKSFVAATRKSP